MTKQNTFLYSWHKKPYPFEQNVLIYIYTYNYVYITVTRKSPRQHRFRYDTAARAAASAKSHGDHGYRRRGNNGRRLISAIQIATPPLSHVHVAPRSRSLKSLFFFPPPPGRPPTSSFTTTTTTTVPLPPRGPIERSFSYRVRSFLCHPSKPNLSPELLQQ